MSVDLSVLPGNIAEVAKELAKKIEFDSINDKGGSGYVLIGRNRVMDRRVVVKFYFWGGGAHAEPKLLSELSSPHVLKVDDAASIDDDDAYFITPFCENGDLDDVMQKGGIGLSRALDYILDIASGASFIHGKGYLHRDLKPSNIFCDSRGRLLIGDFGSVVKKGVQGFAETTSRHSLLYRTPEEIETGRAYEEGDVYQIGIIFYQLLGGFLPYDEQAWLSPKELAARLKMADRDGQLYASKIIEKRILREKLINLQSLPSWCPQELISVIRTCCKAKRGERFENVSVLMAKINNVRAALPDWRLEPHPVLYRRHVKFRVVKDKEQYFIEKCGNIGGAWRRIRASQYASLTEVYESALKL